MDVDGRARGTKEVRGRSFYALILSRSLAVIRNRGPQDMRHNIPDTKWIMPEVKYACHQLR